MKRLLILCLVVLTLSRLALAVPYVTATYYLQGSSYHFDFETHMDDPVYDRGTSWGLRSTIFADLIAPIGWEAFSDFRSTQWFTRYPDYYIPAGTTLYGCSATASYVPSSLDYFLSTTGPMNTYYGTLIPTPIPEPSSLLALGAGLLGLAGLLGRRRR